MRVYTGEGDENMGRILFNPTLIAALAIAAVASTIFVGCSGLQLPRGSFRIGIERTYKFPHIKVASISLEGEWRFKPDPKNLGLSLHYHNERTSDSTWKRLKAPATWEEQGVTDKNPQLKDWMPYGGYAWYRKWIVVPDEWQEYDLRINLGRVDDAEECFLNGKKIGETKSLEQDNIFTLPGDSVRFGKKNLLAIKVLDMGGEGGIVSGPLQLEPITPWDRLLVRLETADKTNVYLAGDRIAFDIVIENCFAQSFDTELSLHFRDFDKRTIYQDSVPVRIGAAKETRISYDLPTVSHGHYDVEIALRHRGLILKRGCSAIPVIDQPIVFKNPDASPFALGGGALFHMPTELHETVGAVRLRQHALVGAYWGRNDLWWGIIEPKKGQFDWEKADSTVSLFEKNSINLLGILCYFSAWSNETAPRNDQDVEEFVNYARHVVERYKGRVKYWEVWNEPNLAHFYAPKPNVEIYTKLLKETYKATKQIDPEAKIIGMVTSLTDLEFIEAALKLGAGSAMDIISVHPYQGQPPTDLSEDTELGKIPKLKALLKKYKVDMPIWITECGWQTLGSITPEIQAEYVVKFYVTQLALGVCEKIYWFNLGDWGPRGAASGGHFGLVYMDQSPKPSYVAYYTMVQLLRDFDKVEKIETPENISGYRFSFAERGCIYVYWTDNGKERISLPENSRTKVDLMGQRTPLPLKRIEITERPVFVIAD